jgi:hypothetical protein
VFYIDCRSRPGQSGSQVIIYRYKGSRVAYVNGTEGVHMGTNPLLELVGIYSGRIDAESDIGRVWRRSAILELVTSIPSEAWNNVS